MRWRKAARLLFIILSSIFGLLVLLFAFINLPFTQRFVTTQTNQILATSNVPIHIDDIQRVLPNSVRIQGIVIRDLNSDTIIHVGGLKARVRLRALIRKRVILKDLDLRQTSMDLLMNYESRKYNIAETFTAGREPKAKKEKKKADWVISVKKGKLSSTHFRMTDSISGIHILQDICGIGLKDFTVSLPACEIVANTLELDDLTGNITIEPRREKKKKEKKGPPWNFGFSSLSLTEIDFTYSKSSDGFSLETVLEEGKIRADQMDVRSKVIDVKRISLAGVSTTIRTGEQSEIRNIPQEKNQDNFPWHLKGRVIDFEDVDLKLAKDGDSGSDSLENGIHVAGLDMKLRRFQLDKDHAGVEINKLGFVFDNGLSINEIKGELDSHAARTELNLAIKTANSQLNLEGMAEEGFLGIISNPGGIPKAGIKIQDTELSLEDISYFNSALKEQPYLKILANRPYSLGGNIDIIESTVNFSGISLRQDQNFNLGMDGSLEHPFPFSEALGNLNLSLSDIDVNWLNKVMAGFGLEERFRNLSSLSLESTISDSLISPDIDLLLSSNLGNIEGSGSISFKSDSFTVHSSFTGMLLGEILNSPELGSFTGSVEATGKGFTTESLESDFALQVDSIWYHGYNYSQASVNGSLRPDEYEFDIQVNDSALMADLTAVLNPGDSLFKVVASGTVKSQLQPLHFYSDTLFVETYVNGNLVKGGMALETDIRLTGTTLKSPFDSAVIRQMDLSFKTDSMGSMLRADA
nr:hypothetical protein [Bacteroidota bacterium]